MIRRIRSSGTEFIKDFLKKYKMSFEVIDKEDIYDIREIKKFIEKLNKICDEYVSKHNYLIMQNENKKIKEKIKKYDEDISDIITERKKERLKFYKTYYENREEDIKRGFEDKIKDLEKELLNANKTNEKWKAMFTEQAMANAKLINK